MASRIRFIVAAFLIADIALSGDARPDLGPTTSTVIVALAVPGSNFMTTGLPLIPDTDRAYIATGDLNGDGAADLVILRSSTLGVYINDGKGSFSAGPPLSLGLAGLTGHPKLGDFNGDGKTDLLLLSTVGARSHVIPTGRRKRAVRSTDPIVAWSAVQRPRHFYDTFGQQSPFGRVFLSRCAPARRRAVKR